MTNQTIQTITVYAASCAKIAPVYFQTAEKLGKLLAKNRITCINGAGKQGLMAAVTDSALKHGGKVIGIIPQFMVDAGWDHPSLTERIVTSDIHERKRLMAHQSDACIALPGGIGTMEELLEIIAWKQLGLYSGKVVVLNVAGYYNDLLNMLKKAQEEKFMPEQQTALWSVASTAEEALQLILKNE
jgi:uncharacterized protein (TIGR00730 family)